MKTENEKRIKIDLQIESLELELQMKKQILIRCENDLRFQKLRIRKLKSEIAELKQIEKQFYSKTKTELLQQNCQLTIHAIQKMCLKT